MNSRGWQTLGIAVALALITLVIFEPVRWHDFIHLDDELYVTKSERVLSGLNWGNVVWAFTNVHANFWHPLTTLSLMLDAELFGESPAGFHATAVALHAASTVLLFLVLRRMTGATWKSAFVAALFAWHPLHVESVAWVSERKDVLSGFFWVLTLWAYLRYIRKPHLSRYCLVVITFALGLMAKPMLVTLPFVLLLLDFWPLRRITFEENGPIAKFSSREQWVEARQLFLEKIPLLLLSFVFSIIAFIAQGKAVTALAQASLADRLARAPTYYLTYISKTFLPANLGVYYPYPEFVSAWHVAVSVAVLLAITGAVVGFALHYPYLPVGWFWFLGALLPVLGIVKIGGFGIADRFTYIPVIGIFLMISWGIPDLLARWRFSREIVAGAAAAALVFCLALTRNQLGYWKDSISLFTRTLAVTSDNPMIQSNLGAVYAERGEYEKAMEHLQAAIRSKPDHIGAQQDLARVRITRGDVAANAHYNLGLALAADQKYDEAITHFRNALRDDPHSADIHNNLGNALAAQGRIEEATQHFRAALKADPRNAHSYNNLANTRLQHGQVDEAIDYYQRALSLDPKHIAARTNLGAALAAKGDLEQAIVQFQKAVELDPQNERARLYLQRALALKKQGEQ